MLNEMESRLGPSFKKVKAICYSKHKQGFYVYAKPNKCDPKTIVKYIGLYLGRPFIATSRIDKYDSEFVTFHYNRHEDEEYIRPTHKKSLQTQKRVWRDVLSMRLAL